MPRTARCGVHILGTGFRLHARHRLSVRMRRMGGCGRVLRDEIALLLATILGNLLRRSDNL